MQNKLRSLSVSEQFCYITLLLMKYLCDFTLTNRMKEPPL